MKQGKGNNVTAGGKVEPRSRAISIDKTANIGVQIVRTKPSSKSLYAGKGFGPPPVRSMKTSNSGSQGSR